MKNTILIAGIGAVIVVTIGYLAYTNFGNPNPDGGSTSENNQAEEESASGTFASLLARGQNLECTFEHNDGANVSSGTVYLANGASQIRGNFTIQSSNAGPMEVHMIRDDGYNYIWGSLFPQGVKSAVKPEERGKLFSTKDGGGIDEDTTFNCKPWRVDDSVFLRPGNIKFMELNVETGQQSGGTIDDLGAVKKQQCDTRVCDQAPEGIPRQQCLQALGC